MKHLLTLTALLISSLAMGQFPNLPYNPDDNGDGLIGVADLQGLLANYGNEFVGAVSSNGAAMVEMGELNKPECMTACHSLPGNWTIPTSKFLMQHMNLVNEVLDRDPNAQEDSDYFWAENDGYTDDRTSNDDQVLVHGISTYDVAYLNYATSYGDAAGTEVSLSSSNDIYDRLCLCSIQEKPHVEYFLCSTNSANDLQSCVNEKVQSGWYPLGAPQYVNASGFTFNQALWRWAD